MKHRVIACVASALLLNGCWDNPFQNTQTQDPETLEEIARRPLAPAQPAVQAAGAGSSDPGAGFDIRLVRVQPSVHLNTEQSCDIIFTGRAEAVEGNDEERYEMNASQHMPVKCHASTGEGWADLVFSPEVAAQVSDVRRSRRVRIRILAPSGGFSDYPIVQFVRIEGENPELARVAPRAAPVAVPSGFDLGQLEEEPGLVGSTQHCGVALVDRIDLIHPNDRRQRSYPAGVQNRMTVHCKHTTGEHPADLVFMPAQALAALEIDRGDSIPVRVISRNGGFSDHPILQYAGQ